VVEVEDTLVKMTEPDVDVDDDDGEGTDKMGVMNTLEVGSASGKDGAEGDCPERPNGSPAGAPMPKLPLTFDGSRPSPGSRSNLGPL
jgi:hypothetical protein